MKYFLILLLLTGCQTTRYHENVEIIRTIKHEQFDYREILNACVAEQIDMCGDLICEDDIGYEIVMQGLFWALNYCYDEPETIDSKYFNKDLQIKIFGASYPVYEDTPEQ